MAKPAITIRQARAEDAVALVRAEREIAATPGFLVSQPEELLEDRFAQKIAALAQADNGRYVVAEVEGSIVGHAMLDPLPLAAVRHVVHLTIAVHTGWQSQGIGYALLSNLVEWAQGAPAVGKIELHVRAPNAAAQKLYCSLGFTVVGRLKRRIRVGPDQYLDDVSMELLV